MTARLGTLATGITGGLSVDSDQNFRVRGIFGANSYSLLLHMDGVDASTTFTDATGQHSVTAVSSAQIDTAQSVFSGASGLFNGTTDRLTLDSATDFTFGTGDFTIAFRMRTSAIGVVQWVYDSRPTGVDGFYPAIFIGGTGRLGYFLNGASQAFQDAAIAADTWYHVELTRQGSDTRLFLDGTQIGSTYVASDNLLCDSSGRPYIGGNGFTADVNGLSGWIDELLIVKGLAVHTSNFTVPALPYSITAGNLSASVNQNHAAQIRFGGLANLSAYGTIAAGNVYQGAATFAGAGNFAPQAYVSVRVQVSWAELEFVQSTAAAIGEVKFNGAGNLSVYANLRAQIAVNYAGAGNLRASVVQANTAAARFAGVGALSADSSKSKSAAATFAGAGNLSAFATAASAIAATFGGIGSLIADSAKFKLAAATFAGLGNFTANATQVSGGAVQQISATFSGIGNCSADSDLVMVAQATFAGAGNLSADSRKFSTVAATFGGAGSLRVLVNQQNSAAAIFGGVGNLNVFASITGATNQWSGEAVFAGAGALSAGVRQNYQSAITFGGVGNLSALSAISSPIAVTFGGVGNFSVSVSLSRTLAATFAGIGNLSTLPNLRMVVAATFGGVGNFNAFGTITGATNVWQGSATFAGQGNLSANVISALQAAIRFGGLGNVSADSGKYKLAAATFAGVCNVRVSAANVKFGEIQFAGSSSFSIGTTSQMQSGAVFAGQGFMRANIAGGRGPRLPTRTGISGEIISVRSNTQTLRRRQAS